MPGAPLWWIHTQYKKQINLVLPIYYLTSKQVIHMHHSFTVLEYSYHTFLDGEHDLEHYSSWRTRILHSMDSNLESGSIMVINLHLIAHNFLRMRKKWVCFIQSGRSPKVVALFRLQTLVAIWYDFFQLHDTIKMKSNHAGINLNHNNIAIRSNIMIYNSV